MRPFLLLGALLPYIEPVAHEQAALTLPRLLLHFPSAVTLVEVERVDFERGAVRYKTVERIAGKGEPRDFRHALRLDGGVPGELGKLSIGRKAVIFGEDSEGQTLTYVEGVWYHARSEAGWDRLTGLRPLYLGCFAGTADELADALRSLLLGREAVVATRPEGRAQLVRYSMKDPHRKVAADGPAGKADPAPADVERARAEQRKAEWEELGRRLREVVSTEGRGSEEARQLFRERGKRLQGRDKSDDWHAPDLDRALEQLRRAVEALQPGR